MPAFRLAAAAFGLLTCLPPTGAIAQSQQIPPFDLIYTRIKPCRIFDTTKTTKIPANSGRTFLISGTGNFAAQGGSANGCAVPASAQAVSLNVTAINGAAAGSLNVTAYTQTTSAAILRYPVSAPVTIGAIADLQQSRLTLRTTNTVHAIGDVTGYFAPRLSATVTEIGSLISQTSRVVSATIATTGRYLVTFDRVIDGCRPLVTTQYFALMPSATINGDTVTVFIADKTGASTNSAFYIEVSC